MLRAYRWENFSCKRRVIFRCNSTVKGRTAIRVFNKFRELKRKPYWGNHFWARGYCVDTVGLDENKIRTYVQYQEKKEREAEQGSFDY